MKFLRYGHSNIFMLFLLIWAATAKILANFFLLPTLADLNIDPVLLNLFIQSITSLIPLIVFCIVTHKYFPPLRFYRPRTMGAFNIILIIAITIFMYPLLSLIALIMNSIGFQNTAMESIAESHATSFLAGLIATALIPTLFEESLFRGYFLAQQDKYGVKRAVILNALFFAFIHLNMLQLPYTFLMGIIIALLVYYTRSILAGMLFHFLINGISVVISFAGTLAAGTATETTPQIDQAVSAGPALQTILILLGVTVVTTAIAFFLLRKFISHNKTRQIKLIEKHGADSYEIPVAEEGSTPFNPVFFVIVAVYILAMISVQFLFS